MTVGENDKKNEGKGFAGISSLVSNVDTTLPPAAKTESAAAAPSAPRPAPQSARSQRSSQQSQHQEPSLCMNLLEYDAATKSQQSQHQEPSMRPPKSSGAAWNPYVIAIIGVIICLFILSDNSGEITSPENSSSRKTPSFNQAPSSKNSSESESPKFRDYASLIYDGPRASVNLVSEFDKKFRTRIRKTQSQPVNFAGEYVLSTWGCGTSCLMGVAVSSRTGRVVALPGDVCCWKGTGERVIFKKNSRLIVLAGLISNGGEYGAHFYELKNDKFVHIKTVAVKKDDSSNASSELSVSSQTYKEPPVQQKSLARPIESKPPAGQNLVLSREQIRYCLAEDIRLDAAKSAVNNYIDADVERFNAMVSDYNSRCGSFKYQFNNRGRNDLNSAQRDIEPYRSRLQSEGRSRFSRGVSLRFRSEAIIKHPALNSSFQITMDQSAISVFRKQLFQSTLEHMIRRGIVMSVIESSENGEYSLSKNS